MSRLLGLVAAGSVLLSCASDREVGPPEIAVGFDVCARCGMSIDDLRFAAAARIDGEILAYDDVGEPRDRRFRAAPDRPLGAPDLHGLEDRFAGTTAAVERALEWPAPTPTRIHDEVGGP